MLRAFLTTTSLLISVVLWLPSQIKIVRKRSAADYNWASFAAILWLQIASFTLAWLDHSRGLECYFAVNGVNVGIMLGLILRYR